MCVQQRRDKCNQELEILPGIEPVLRRGVVRTDVQYYGGVAGWGGGVALGLQRRGERSKSAFSISLSLTSAGSEWNTKSLGATAQTHSWRIFGPRLRLDRYASHYVPRRWACVTRGSKRLLCVRLRRVVGDTLRGVTNHGHSSARSFQFLGCFSMFFFQKGETHRLHREVRVRIRSSQLYSLSSGASSASGDRVESCAQWICVYSCCFMSITSGL
jgi:hypothetical protein